MTNFDRWNYYMRDVFSPKSWVEAGWLYVVTSALERRVWYGNYLDRPLFPNLYLILIGPPACGKGLVVQPVMNLLSHWTRRPQDMDRELAIGEKVDMLFNTGPDKITPEKLYTRMAQCTRTLRDEAKVSGRGMYMHASMTFVLEELNSLFRRNMDEVPKFLLRAYDCGDYEYDTKHNGRDLIRSMCMNFMAVGTPTVLQEAREFKIFDDGFTSRTLFIFEREPRYYSYELPGRDESQLAAFEELKPWIKRLAGLYGPIEVDPIVPKWLDELCQREHRMAVQTSGPKMQSYLGRRGVTIKKLAAAFHFSDSLEMKVPLSCFERAVEWLKPIEAKMRGGFALVGRNELHPLSETLIEYCAMVGGCKKQLLWAQVCSEVKIDEFDAIIDGLVLAERLNLKTDGKYYVQK